MLDSVIDDIIYQSHNEPNEDIIDVKKLIDLATQEFIKIMKKNFQQLKMLVIV